MAKKLTRKPTHPGAIVKHDILAELGVSVTEAAKRLNISRKHFSLFLNGSARCTVDLACRLAKATNTSAESWLNMQMHYDLWIAEHEAHLGDDVRPFAA